MTNCPTCSYPLSDSDAACPACGRAPNNPDPAQAAAVQTVHEAAPADASAAGQVWSVQAAVPTDVPAGSRPQGYAQPYGGYPQAAAPVMPPPQPRQSTGQFFVRNILGLIFPVVLIGVCLLSMAFLLHDGYFASFVNFANIGRQLLFTVPLVAGAVLTVRSRGLDLTLAAIVTLGAVLYGLDGSIVPALFACVVVGAATGAVIIFLRVPSLYVGLAVSPILMGICYILTDGTMRRLEFIPHDVSVVAAFVGLACAFLYNFFTCIGKPKEVRETQKNRPADIVQLYLAYPLAALLAGLSGIALVSHMRVMYAFGGTAYYPLLLMVFAAVGSSRLLDNRVAPVLYALAILLLTRVMNNQSNLMALDNHFQMLLEGIITATFLVVYAFANRPFRAQQYGS